MKPIKVIFALMIVVVCAAFFVATPRNVQAAPLMGSWAFEDDMESGTWPWLCGVSTESINNRCSWVHGQGNVWVDLQIQNGWGEIGQKFTIPFTGNPTSQLSCKATMFIRRGSGAAPFTGNLEVLDYNTWTYINVKPFSLTKSGWVAITTNTWSPPRPDPYTPPDVYIRTVHLNSTGSTKTLQVDLLRVSCTW